VGMNTEVLGVQVHVMVHLDMEALAEEEV